MKILVISSLYTPYRRGGAEVFVENLVAELKKKQTVSVLTCGEWKGFRSFFPETRIVEGVRVIRFYPLNFFSFIHIARHSTFTRFLWGVIDMFNPHSVLALLYIVWRESPDRILVHGLKGLGYILAWVLNHQKCAWVFTPHDIQLAVPGGVLSVGSEALLSSRFLRLYRSITRALIGSPPVVVSSSRFLIDFYARYDFFASSIMRVIHSPKPKVPAVMRRTQNLPAAVFLFIGQLVEGKGIRLILEAFGGLGRPDVQLHIVGSGPLEYLIQEAASHDSRISFFGYCGPSEKYQRFADATYTIVASTIIENSPSVVYESLSIGVPVIVAESGGAAELIAEGVNGFLFAPNNLSSLHQALIRALSLRDYPVMSRAAAKTVQDCTSARYVNQLLAIFENHDRTLAK